MFSFLRKTEKNKTVDTIPSSQNKNSQKILVKERTESIDDLKINYDSSVAIDMSVEVGGGKGWPVDVTTILYHKLQGLICIGTSGGAVYVYGDGFQFMRPWLINDPNPVRDILALFSNRILVAFEDSSIVVMELPTLDVVDLLPATWLSNESPGAVITSIHVDLPMEKNFAYVGTSDGSILILDANTSNIRVCDYKISNSDLAVSNTTTVVDIQSCPKDEKYLAIGLNNSNENKKTKATSPGSIVIFDLVKHKPYRTFSSALVSSMAWIHTGDLLYVGTVDGHVLCVNFEKNVCTSVWDSKQELVDGDSSNNNNDDSSEDSDGPKIASIKRVSWMCSQVNSDKDSFGVLFVLLDTNNDNDNEDLSNVIVGLSPTGPVDTAQELSLIYSLPPIQSEIVKTFRIVPTFDISSMTESDADQLDGSSATPAILILSYSQSCKCNQLKIVRCPTSGLSHWALEMGMTLDPRQAVEVLPSQSKITCMSAIKSEKVTQSITTALIVNNNDVTRRISSSYSMIVESDITTPAGFNYDENKTIQMDKNKTMTPPPRSSVIHQSGNRSASRKLSVREFFFDNSLLESESKWEMTLAHGIQKENINTNNNSQRQQDLVIKGHADGTVIIWGVSLPDNGKELGRGNIWLPLQVLKCGTCAVVTLNHDESSGLLLAADESGIVVIWELFDENINMSATDLLSIIYDEAVTMVANQVGQNLEPNPDDHLTIKDFAKFCYYSNKYRPTSFKFLLKSRFHDKVTCSLFLSCVLSLLVGTQDGSIYFCADFRKGTFSKLDIDLSKIDNSSAVGAVISLTLSTFELKNKLIPAVYCVFSSGHLLVIELKNFSIIFATLGSLSQSFEDLTLRSKSNANDNDDKSLDNYNISVESNVFNSFYSVIRTPDVIDISLYRLSIEVNNIESQSSINSSNSNDCGNNTSTLPPPPPKSKMTNIFSSLTKTKSATTNVPSVPREEHTTTITNVESVSTLSQSEVPRYLMFIKGRSLVSYDLSKSFVNSKPSNREFLSVAPLKSILVYNLISKKKIIASKLLEYIPNEKDENSDNLLCFACVNSLGVFLLVSVKNNTVISHTNLLESVLEDEVTNLDFGIVLDNSNCFMIQSSSMIYSATPICSTHSLALTFPDRGTVVCNPPTQQMMLINGREAMIEQTKLLLKKRRSSLLNIIAVTDLVKLFSKSKNANQKDELFGEEEVNVAASKGNKMPNTNTALATCEELGKALEERGEKINRITKKMDLFKETASQFKQQAHEQREKLKKQNNNWGLF